MARHEGRFAGSNPLAVIILLLALLAGGPAFADTQVINSLAFQRANGGGHELHIRLNTAMRYLNHAPLKKGQTLQIRLQPIKIVGAGDIDFEGRSTLSWKATADIPLTEVAYEGDLPSGQSLVLKFTRPVQYTVRSAKDLRSIVVTIQPGTAKRQPAAAVPPPPTPYSGPAAAATAAQSAPPAAAAVGEVDLSHPYVINLLSSVTPIRPASLPVLESFRGRRLYTTQFEKDGKRWNRLRLGFFPTADAARNALGAVKASYPGAWIAKASAAERQASGATAVRLAVSAPRPSSPPPVASQTPSRQATAGRAPAGALPPGGLAKLMDQAAVAMTAKDYRRAVQLYTKVLQYNDAPTRQQAQELLGLARERSGQLAHAKAEYETYLGLYPKGEGADRVRQRLAGLLTARSKPQEKLRRTDKEKEDKWQTQVTGGFSQFYSYDESAVDDMAETVNRSDLNSSLDLGVRLRKSDYEFGARFNGGHVFDFRDQGEDVSHINTLFVEAIDRGQGLTARFGRQSRSSGGVLGRFDGALLDFQILPQARLSVVGGFPVDSSKELEVDPDRHFYGAALNLGTFADSVDLNLYAIRQEVDGIIDRRAVGGEIRYFNSGRSVFTLVDYDTSYDQLNIALLSANWVFENRATAGLTLDYRNSPSLATTNALQGQGVEEISDLLQTMTEEEIRALAEDRTARNRSATLSASHPIGKSFQVSGNVTVSNMSATEASGGVPATPGTGNEFYYSAQLIGSGLIMENDVNIFGLRYSDTSNADTSTFSFDARYPLTRNWRLNPRLRTDYKQNNNDDGEQIRVRPSLRTDYRPTNWMRVDLEAGMEWTEDRLAGDATRTVGYNMILGYRVNF